MSKKQGWVYLLSADSTQLYKIGVTTSTPEKRIRSLSTGCPYDLNSVYAVRLPNYDGMEEHLHEQFADNRKSGEWFELEDHEVVEAIEILRQNRRVYIADQFRRASDMFHGGGFEPEESKLANTLAGIMSDVAHEGKDNAIELLRMIQDSDATSKYASDSVANFFEKTNTTND